MKLKLVFLVLNALVLVTGLVACGGSASSPTRSGSAELRNPSVWPIPNSECTSLFGGGVAAAMCKEDAKKSFTIALTQPQARYGSAIGMAQAMGVPLHDGDRFRVSPIPADTELLIRIDIGSRERVGTARFKLPAGTTERSGRLYVSVGSNEVTSKIQLDPGPSITADTVYVPRIRGG